MEKQITYGQYMSIFDRLLDEGKNVEETMPTILLDINEEFCLPKHIYNLTHRVKKHIDSGGDKDKCIELVKKQKVPEYLGISSIGLTVSDILNIENGLPNFKLHNTGTNRIAQELEYIRRAHSKTQAWLYSVASCIWNLPSEIDDEYKKKIFYKFQSVYKKSQTINRDKSKQSQEDFLNEPFQLEKPESSLQKLQKRLQDPVPSDVLHKKNVAVALATHFGSICGTFVNENDKILAKTQRNLARAQEELKRKEEELKKKDEELKTILKESHVQQEMLRKEIDLLQRNNEEKSVEIANFKQKFDPKNVKRREKTRDKRKERLKEENAGLLRQILALQTELAEKEKEQSSHARHEQNSQSTQNEIVRLKDENERLKSNVCDLECKNASLETNLKKNKQKKISLQKKVSFMSNVERKENETLAQMKDQVKSLKAENRVLEVEKDRLTDQIMSNDVIKTFHGNRYNQQIRLTVMTLLGYNVSVRNCGEIVQKVMKILGGKEFERIPQKSFAARMLKECEVLAKIEVGTKILESKNCTLGIDGTTKRFNEYVTTNITTGEGLNLSMGVKDLASGNTENYFSANRDIFLECASYLVPKDSSTKEIHTKMAELLEKVKNTMSDRHIVNKCLNKQIQDWRSEALPLIKDNYNELSEQERENITRMNNLFCGLHVIINLGTVAKDTLKNFETIAAKTLVNNGFVNGNSRSYNLLWEASKNFTYTHGYQKAGEPHTWSAYLEGKNETNRMVCLRGERINIIFVAGGAAYFHRQHIIDFLDMDMQVNRLGASLLDFKHTLFQAIFRALGIIDKLLTGPMFRLIEDSSKHIFELNQYWHVLTQSVDRFSENPAPLIVAESPFPEANINKDDVYAALFEPTQNPELDNLTEECLRMLCCSFGVLLRRQLEDQLPGGKYHQPSIQIMQETRNAPSHNMLTERDFAQLDRILHEKPTMSTVALSGLIAFKNNKTAEWLLSLPEEERSQMMERARKEAPSLERKNQETKKALVKSRQELLVKRKAAKDKKEGNKANLHEQLTSNLTDFGGLWTTTEMMYNNLKKIKAEEKQKAIIGQLKFRKHVLQNKFSDGKLLNLTVDKKKLTTNELERNLETVINESSHNHVVSHAMPLPTTIIRSREERLPLIRKAMDERRSREKNKAILEAPKAKKKKPEYPQLEGKKILHKWDDGAGLTEWWDGIVVRALDDTSSKECRFEVKYKSDDNLYEVALYEDLENHDLVIV